jgi:hypothetical protein
LDEYNSFSCNLDCLVGSGSQEQGDIHTYLKAEIISQIEMKAHAIPEA